MILPRRNGSVAGKGDKPDVFEIGPTLREARVRRKLTLTQVSDDTRIRIKYLQAMEDEDFEVIPGITYVRGFLRTYADYLDLDADVIIGEFNSHSRRFPESEPFGGVSALGRPHGHRSRNTLLLTALVCLLVLAIIYVLELHKPKDSTGIKTNPGAIGLSSTPKASGSPNQKPTSGGSASVAVNKATLVVQGGTCWVQVSETSLQGKQLFAGTLNDGATRTYKSEKPLVVVVGAPSVLTIKVGGGQTKKLSGAGPVTYRIDNGKVAKL
jgi:cytoskeleton protein RodZ